MRMSPSPPPLKSTRLPSPGRESILSSASSERALSTIPMAIVARMTRSSMLEVLRQDYIKTARAKGLSEIKVVLKHALRNGLIPVVTVIGLQFGILLGGAILTETVFAWPGVGKWIYEGVVKRDYMVIQGGTMLVATAFVVVNTLVDILYAVINPRISVK